MTIGEINPVLQLIQVLAEIQLLLDVEVINLAHLLLVESGLQKAINYIPISIIGTELIFNGMNNFLDCCRNT